ncbi:MULTISPECIES: DsbA family protein [unclassified Corynebacterium]|uniref:DsbA family protein n=1 Tax=unclassified Corynebacterium TaxID=2624378 RepID=UPI00309B7891
MSQKIKAPNDKNRSFLWGIVALVVICVVFIGFMVFNGRKSTDVELSAADVSFSVAVEDGVVQLRSNDVADDAPTADVYEDYSCTHCADLVEADSESMEEALDAGNMNVNLHTVNFLDSNGNESSSRTGAVAMAIAETGDAGAFWAFHEKAFGDQSEVARDWRFDELADAAEQLGVDSAVVDSIRDESVVETYKPDLQSNGDRLRELMGDQAGTPALYIDGEYLTVERDPEDPSKLKDWVPDVVGSTTEDAPQESATETESADSE